MLSAESERGLTLVCGRSIPTSSTATHSWEAVSKSKRAEICHVLHRFENSKNCRHQGTETDVTVAHYLVDVPVLAHQGSRIMIIEKHFVVVVVGLDGDPTPLPASLVGRGVASIVADSFSATRPPPLRWKSGR
jgi:hypothetical protein